MIRELVVGKPVRAAIYVRVSSERQANEDRVSIEAQLKDCEALCNDRGYQIVCRHVDKDKYRVNGKYVQPSGERKDRPAYQAMLAAGHNDEYDVIVAWKEDRLYRGMYAAMPLSELLDAKGKRLDVELVRETFDRRMLGIKAAMGKIEVDNIRERMLMGRREKLERGEAAGGKHVKYGYKRVDHRLTIDEAEAEIVRLIFEWYLDGVTKMEMRRRLHTKGIRSRMGDEYWSIGFITKMLASEVYATGKLITTLDNETFETPCPPIISMEQWHEAERLRQRNRLRPRNVKRDYLCVGLVYCVCGRKSFVKTIRSNLKKGYKSIGGVYICHRDRVAPETMPEGCYSRTGSKRLDDYVWNFVKHICSNPQLVKAAVDAKLAELQTRHDSLEKDVEKLKSCLDEIVNERQWIITQARKGRITEEDMELQLGQLQIQEWEHRREIDEQQALLATQQQATVLGEWAEQYLGDIHAGLAVLETDVDKLDNEEFESMYKEMESWRFIEKFPESRSEQLKWAILEEKRRVVRTLIDRVVVSKVQHGERRKFTPILALDIPYEKSEFLDSNNQSLKARQ